MSDGMWDEDQPVVEDPEALRRAEEAVAHEPEEPLGPEQPIDEPWEPVATQVGEPLIGGLQEVAGALQAAGIPFGWDPYDPRDAPAYLPPLISGIGRTFTVVVPRSQALHARDALGDLRVEGVTFAWDDAAWGPESEAVQPPVAWGESTPSGAPEPDMPTPVTGLGGRPISDNARLRAMTEGAGAGAGALAAVLVALVILGLIVAFVLLRG